MGPLVGLRVVEIAGFGPGPMAGMLLADQGAEVIRIERPAHDAGFAVDAKFFVHNRGKRVLALDLKKPDALNLLLSLIDRADVVIEGFRPGVAERMGFGPDVVHERNPALIFARITGWGQDGPHARVVAHDINVVAATGALSLIGSADGPPVMPLNLVADFGGGAMYAVFGILAALFERQTSGKGQVVDVSMAEGALSLMASTFGYVAAGIHKTPRGQSLLDGGLPWYGIYATADDRWVTIGALEPAFFASLIEALGLDPAWREDRSDRARWGELRGLIAHAFRQRTRDDWAQQFEGVDACFEPMLEVGEVIAHPQFAARESVVELGGFAQPGVAPRFSRSRASASSAASNDEEALLAELGFDAARIAELRTTGALR